MLRRTARREAFGRALGVAPVALGHPRAFDHELADLTRRDFGSPLVLQGDAVARHRAADRQGAALAARARLDDPFGVERAFGGPEVRDEARLRTAGCSERVVVGPVDPVAAEGDQPQALQPARPRRAGDMPEQRGRGAEHRDPALAYLAHEALTSERGGGQQLRRGSGQQAAQHGAQSRGDGRRIEQRGPVVGGQAEAFHGVDQVGQQRPMGLERPFRRAGRA